MNLEMNIGMIKGFQCMGIKLDKFDEKEDILYISLPKEYDQRGYNGITSEEVAIKFKELTGIRLKYKLRNEIWTKEKEMNVLKVRGNIYDIE